MIQDKLSLIKAYRASLEEMLAEAIRAMNEAQEEANNHVGAMESRYDTFKEEAQYLASAHLSRIAELQQDIAAINQVCKQSAPPQCIAAGSLVTVLSEDERIQYQYLILPGGDGNQHVINNQITYVLSPRSPIAQQLLGKEIQDDVMFTFQGVNLEGFIQSIK